MRYLIRTVIFSSLIFFSIQGTAGVNTDSAITNQQTPINFLVLADIHFDPFTSCRSRPCPLIEKLRRAPASEWAAILNEYDKAPPQYLEDTNYPLLVSSLAAAGRISQAQKVQFALILGDFIGHEYKRKYKHYATNKLLGGYQDFVRKTLEFLNLQLSQTFPDINVYSIVGNNDSYQDDYVSNPKGNFFQDTGKLWSSSIKNNASLMQNEFQNAGYYAVTLPNLTNLRLIVMNTNLFSYKAQGSNLSPAADEELRWLHMELQLAKQNQQKVLLAMHIPEGIDVNATLRIKLFTLIQLWKSDYSQRFQAELQTYAPELVGILAGHLHTDWLQILTFNQGNEIPEIGTPAISPNLGTNPGFKIFTYTPQAKQLESCITYYYPLNGQKPWNLKYDFQPDLSLNSRIYH